MSYPNKGNLKMRGRKLHLFSCRCCSAWNDKRFPPKRLEKKILDSLEAK